MPKPHEPEEELRKNKEAERKMQPKERQKERCRVWTKEKQWQRWDLKQKPSRRGGWEVGGQPRHVTLGVLSPINASLLKTHHVLQLQAFRSPYLTSVASPPTFWPVSVPSQRGPVPGSARLGGAGVSFHPFSVVAPSYRLLMTTYCH